MLEKNKIIHFSSLAVSLLENIPRLLITLKRKDLAETFELTYGEVGLRMVVMFCLSWLVLSYNIKWKHNWKFRTKRNTTVTDFSINVFLLFFGVTILTFFKQFTSDSIFNPRGYFFGGLFTHTTVLVILLLLSWLVNLTTQYQQNILEKEQATRKVLHHQLEALRSQINPHFLFNSLNSLNALIRQKSNRASVFVDKLSWLLRATLQQSDKDYISIQEELDYLEAYIFLQKERFGEKLNIEISIPENWKKKILPSFSLQLLIENAIKHNVVSFKQPLHVNIFKEGDFLIISNPIQKRRDAVDSIGKGLSNLSTRFQILKKEDIQIEKTGNLFLVKLPIS